MRYLLTGSTAQQASPEAHRKSVNFTGLLWELLRSDGKNLVKWLEPSVRWTGEELRSEYDHVFVGLASPMAMGANRLYGALSVLEQLRGSKRVTVVVDAPDPDLVYRGLRSVQANPEALTKSFFSNRKEYDLVRDREESRRLLEQVDWLLAEAWPQVLVPAFPWTTTDQIAEAMPGVESGSVGALNLDFLVRDRFKPEKPLDAAQRLQRWSFEKTSSKKWPGNLNLAFQKTEIKGNHRLETDKLHSTIIRESYGHLVGVHRGTAWWTPKLAMALAQETPVSVEAWEPAADTLGPPWSVLPGTMEVWGPSTRSALAIDQASAYFENVPANAATAMKALKKAAAIKNVSARKKETA